VNGSYTLLEFVLAAGMFGILMMLVLPSYHQARKAALISTVVKELLFYGRSCAIIHATGIGEPPSPRLLLPNQGMVRIRTGCQGVNGGATIEGSWGDARAADITCMQQRSTPRSRLAVLVIHSTDAIECQFLE